MSFDFVVDRVVRGKIYPHLTRWQAEPYTVEWRQFGDHWPWTIPLRIQEYCEHHNVPVRTFGIDHFPATCWYPIALGFFNFDVDYVSLVPANVLQHVICGRLKLLFFYHEGDNPYRIKHRLDALMQEHGLDPTCYVFVSANSEADRIPGFVYFPDFELWYWQRNIDQPALTISTQPRQRDFTVLARTHKWWRATVIADLARQGLLHNSFWSYCESAHGDQTQCPIEIDKIPGLRHSRDSFLANAPYFCDSLSQSQRNDHSINSEPQYFQNAWCQIVLETEFDVDQSLGVFLSEKTFKPIKHGQMFFIAGACGSLQLLRDLGYKTFDHVLDNDYDLEINNTRRWILLRQAIIQAHARGLESIWTQCVSDIEHNQQLFQQRKTLRLNRLLEKINAQRR